MNDKLSTTLLDIYEAAGCKLSEDRTSVEMNAGQQLKPFDIVVRVIPTIVEFNPKETERVTFSVILNPYVEVVSGVTKFFDLDETLTIPVNQVRIAKNL